ncbi:MAG: 3-deoxy-8-phosphooctulonate synthase [Puniceicoccales bacterium]|nr:3-deoxy-8-phosphooctulonate synthase [Puniceicoccales bacterium]
MMTTIYDPHRLLLVAGPCLLENTVIPRRVAEILTRLRDQHSSTLTVVFKGSFDKANRTSYASPRGMGMAEGLRILADVKREFALPLLTDIHWPDQAKPAAEVCDILQIPAFLCRQTDLLVAAARTGRPVNVKKGQFLSPGDMSFVVQKLKQNGGTEIWQTERGTTFGYGNLVVDMRSFTLMRENHRPCLFDVTHSLQMPGKGTGVTEGDRRYAKPLALAALAAGADGLYLETHPDPASALSDAATQLPLEQLESFVEEALTLWGTLRKR